MFFPFSLPFFPSNFQGPSSGDLSLFSPQIHIAGNPQIEKKVVTEVASYGTQLGTLSKVVLALAEKEEGEHVNRHISQLKERVKEIDGIKKNHTTNLEEDIKCQLKELKKNDKRTFKRLISDHHEAIKKDAENSNG